MPHGTAQSVQSPDNENVTRLKCLKTFGQAGTFGLRPGGLAHENAVLGDAVFCEGFDLQRQVLIVGAHPRVAELAWGSGSLITVRFPRDVSRGAPVIRIWRKCCCHRFVSVHTGCAARLRYAFLNCFFRRQRNKKGPLSIVSAMEEQAFANRRDAEICQHFRHFRLLPTPSNRTFKGIFDSQIVNINSRRSPNILVQKIDFLGKKECLPIRFFLCQKKMICRKQAESCSASRPDQSDDVDESKILKNSRRALYD